MAQVKMRSLINNTQEKSLRKLFEFSIFNHLNFSYLHRLHTIAPFPVTLIIVAICNVIYLLTRDDEDLTKQLAVVRSKIFEGEYYRLLTACITHNFW